MPIPVKIEMHIQGCQQLVSDILSQFVIWANRIHVLENKLVLDVKEVQRKKSFARFEPWEKYASATRKLSSWEFFRCQKIIVPQSSSKWTIQSPQNSLMRPVQNRGEIKPHFHPFTKPQKIKTSMYRCKLLKFHLNQAEFGQGSSQSEILGENYVPIKKGSTFFDTKFNGINWARETGFSITTSTTASNQFCENTAHFPVETFKPNIISPVLSVSNIWDVFVSKCSFSLENYFHLGNN